MSPKKKLRAGEPAQCKPVATTVSAVSVLQKSVAQHIDTILSSETTVLQDVLDGWWVDPDAVFNGSLRLLKCTGILDEEATVDDLDKLMLRFEEWPLQPGLTKTSILQWNSSRSSLWKGFAAMSDIAPIARSIALTSFREARDLACKMGLKISPPP
jgi:hypothetical protein